MLNEKKLIGMNLEDLGFINVIFENMSDEEKRSIKFSMTKNKIKDAEDFLKQKTKQLDMLNESYKKNFNPFGAIQLSIYERYYLFAQYHHFLMTIKTNNTIQGAHKLQLYAMYNYKDSYIANQKLIYTLVNILSLLGNIQKSKIGICDIDIPNKTKNAAIKNSINTIINFLEKESKDSKDSIKLSNSFIGENSYRHIEILDIITKNNINYLNQSMDRYEFFEQILLAPIKLNNFIDKNKYANNKNNLDNLEKYLKNAGLYDDKMKSKIDYISINQNEFFKIQKNQIKQYCITVFSEFFNISIFDLKRIYTVFYSSAITNTNFLTSFYNHMPTKKIEDYIVTEEFLPFLQDDFMDIIYEVTPNNIPEKELIKHQLPIENIFDDDDIYKYLHIVTNEDEIPEDSLRFKLNYSLLLSH